MININFQKIVALTLTFVVAFSSPAFATTAPAPTKSIPTIVKQAEGSVAFSKTIVEAQDALLKAAFASRNARVNNPFCEKCPTDVAKSIAEAQSLIDNALATYNSGAANDKEATAKSLAQAETTIGNALCKILSLSCTTKLSASIQNDVVLTSDDEIPRCCPPPPGELSIIVQLLAGAKIYVGDATAIAKGFSRNKLNYPNKLSTEAQRTQREEK